MMEDFNEIYGRHRLTSVQKTEIPKICNTIMRATGNSWRVEGQRRFNLYRVRKPNRRAAQPQTRRNAEAAKNDAGGGDFESAAESNDEAAKNVTLDNVVNNEMDNAGGDADTDTKTDPSERDVMPYLHKNPLRNVRRAYRAAQPRTRCNVTPTFSPRHAQLSRSPTGDVQMGGEAEAAENDAGGGAFESATENVTLDNALNNEMDNDPLNDEGFGFTSCRFGILGCEEKLSKESIAMHEWIFPKRCFGCPDEVFCMPVRK